MAHTATILLLGSGELGREFVISAKRLGARVIACDAYDNAPAMQLADGREVFSMLDGAALRAVAEKHRPDYIVPEIEAIRTEVLAELEAEGFNVVPSARATQLTMNRDAIRDLAAGELGLATSRYRYAESLAEVSEAAAFTGFPCVIKPVMSSSGKGQSKVDGPDGLAGAWDYAVAGMRGDRARVIVEQFVDFDYEITLLTVRHAGKDGAGGITFCPPIGHR
ncbi:MAG: phosphoribosylglycinamide formyltransferase 2, partial [Erythrobacter sp. 34-65-8]